LPENVDIAVSPGILGEYIVVGDQDYSLRIPHLGLLSELPLEDPKGARAADVVGHKSVHVDPYVFSRSDYRGTGLLGQDFLGKRHRLLHLHQRRDLLGISNGLLFPWMMAVEMVWERWTLP